MTKEYKIRLVALDIYGTVLCSDDWDNEMPPRNGIEKFFDHCASLKVPIISSSDAYLEDMKHNLKDCFDKFPERKMKMDRFFSFFQMDRGMTKNFEFFLEYHNNLLNIEPKIIGRELLVIGDSDSLDFGDAKLDIGCARNIGAKCLKVPIYNGYGDEFDFSKIDLRKL